MCLLQWTEKQIQRKNSFIIPHFGVIKYQKDDKQNKWQFHIESSAYIIDQNAKLGKTTNIKSITTNDLYSSPAIKCHISSLLKYSSSLSESQLQVGLKHIFLKLAEQIGRSAASTKDYNVDDHFDPHCKIIINFGWGYLLCLDGVIDFKFTMKESLIINPSIPRGLKNIPKKYMQSCSSLLSISSIPCNVKIGTKANHNITNDEEYALIHGQMKKYKKLYKLPVDNECDNPLMHLSSSDTIPVCQ